MFILGARKPEEKSYGRPLITRKSSMPALAGSLLALDGSHNLTDFGDAGINCEAAVRLEAIH